MNTNISVHIVLDTEEPPSIEVRQSSLHRQGLVTDIRFQGRGGVVMDAYEGYGNPPEKVAEYFEAIAAHIREAAAETRAKEPAAAEIAS